MIHGSAYSTQATTSTTQGSTHGFLSFSSQSLIEGANGPTLRERLSANLDHLAANLNRYTGFPPILFNISMIIRIVQVYAIFIMPNCKDFWNSNSSTHTLIQIITVPLHFCLSQTVTYHEILMLVLFAYFFINFVITFNAVWKDPLEYSMPNSIIYYIYFSHVVLIPIFFTFSCSIFGYLLRNMIFDHVTDPLMIVSIVFGILCVILGAFSHTMAFILIKNSPKVNFSILCRPWASFITVVFILECYIYFLSFLEELLNLNDQIMLVIFSVFCLVFANPFFIYLILSRPWFNDYADTRHICTLGTVCFFSIILMNLRYAIPSLTPTLLFTILILLFVILNFVYSWIVNIIISKNLMKLYSVYKQSQAVLPPTSPFIFSGNRDQNQVPLSQDAYNVMQAFLSLDINKAREFQMIVVIGASAHMPAVKNIDFIRWGLNYFVDDSSLLICAQICNHFRENAQTQTVLLQYLRENANLSVFTRGVVTTLDYDHTDVISDNPVFLKLLKTKAVAAQVRCRRCTSSFWNCVLNHNLEKMSTALCRLRNAAKEAQTHYDELMRCYPLSLDAISLYLSFLIETKCSFLECNEFINETSSRFIEMKSGASDYAQTIDSVSILMKDTNKTYSEYVTKLTTYAEQERRVKTNSMIPQIAIYSLAIISFLFIIGFLIAIIVVTLTNFYTYPSLLEIIDTGSNVIIELASLTLSSRRLCLFSKGLIQEDSFEEDSYPQYTSLNNLKNWMIEKAERLPQLSNTFFVTSTLRSEMIDQLVNYKTDIYMFGDTIQASLASLIELLSTCIRNIVTNIPSYYSDTPDINDYSGVCQSDELKNLVFNIKPVVVLINAFTDEFQKIADDTITTLDSILYYFMIIMPIVFVVLFGLILWYIVYYIKSESQFRMTLYLSFPEQVASAIVHKISITERRQVAMRPETNFGSMNTSKVRKGGTSLSSHIGSSNVSSIEESKSKAITVESLYQFATMSTDEATTGIVGYAISMFIFLLLGAIAMFAITFYARSINSSFSERSRMLCYSAQRFSCLQYSTLLAIESFNSELPDISLFDNDQLYQWASEYINATNNLHLLLTYGDNSLSYDYRVYDQLASLFEGTAIHSQEYVEDISETESIIQHDGYRTLGLEARIQLLLTATKGIIENFKIDPTLYNPQTPSWSAINHLLLTHVSEDLILTTGYYLDGVNNVISSSFLVALAISLVSIFALLCVFLGPILIFSRNVSRYFTLSTRLLASVPPEVFERTLYIQKWLQGRITRTNFRQYEATFKRTVSSGLQSSISKISPEKIILFTTEGQFVDIGSVNTDNLEQKDLKGLLSLFFDVSKDSNLVDSIQRAFVHFQDAKDKTDSVVIHATSRDGAPMAVKLTGITTADSATVIGEIQRFYAFVALLITDVTKETEDENKYQTQKAATLALLESLIPRQFAERMHNGEPSISFSAGIGTVMALELTNYQQFADIVSGEVIADILSDLRNAVGRQMATFTNVSNLYIRNGKAIFIAGLFNDEQNGRTEAEDMLHFSIELNKEVAKVAADKNVPILIKYGVATGGPIYCRVMMEQAPITLIDGEIYLVAEKLLEKAVPKQMLFERTTFECLSSIEMDPAEVGQFEMNDRTIHVYSIQMDSYLNG